MRWLLPPVLWLSCVLAMVLLDRLLPGATLMGSPLNYAGLVPLAAGIVLLVWSSGRFRRIGTNIRTFDDPGQLVTGGPFAISRNPMYLGFVLALIGIALVLDAATAWGPPLVFLAACNFWYIPFEEQAARQVFGDAYAAYRNHVRRWI